MSLGKLYFTRCDGCGRPQSRSFGSSKDSRAAARRDGWDRVAQGDGKPMADRCPSCVRRAETAAAALEA